MPATHEAALELGERQGFEFYDALIVAASLEAGCTTLWSEDMQDGRVTAGRLTGRMTGHMTLRDPFTTPPG